MKKIILACMAFVTVTCLPSCGCQHTHLAQKRSDTVKFFSALTRDF